MKLTMTTLALTFVASALAHASTFENMKGTYALSQCDAKTKNIQDNVCNYSKMVVHAEGLSTAIYFSKDTDTVPRVRSFGFPGSTRGHSGARYSEEGDKSASYQESSRALSQTTTMTKEGTNIYRIQILRESATFNESESFDVTLHKMSDQAPQLPTVPGDDEDPD